MKLSLNWIKDYVNIPADMDLTRLAYDLTMSTVEVEGAEQLARRYDGIIVGIIREVLPHPNADKLRICRTDIGGEEKEIVCGGSNLAVGQKVVVACPGAKVRWHGEGDLVEIKNAKLRGVESYGMICAAVEIGMADLFPTEDDHAIVDLSAFDIEAGTPLAKALDLDDIILEIDNKSMTNRPDLWGHYGIAREFATLAGRELKPLETVDLSQYAGLPALDIKIENDDCLRYSGLKFDNVSVSVSPMNMRIRLFYCGMRGINFLADLTNYLMLEMGQPMHAFSIETIKDSHIIVRNAREGETITTLDGVERNLDPSMLVIADPEKAVAIAGVMGGENTEVTDNTVDVFIESAYFQPTCVRRTSTRLGLRSEASIRFEKGINMDTVLTAAERAAQLMQLTGGGVVVGGAIDNYPTKHEAVTIELALAKVNALLGTEISDEKIHEILKDKSDYDLKIILEAFVNHRINILGRLNRI